MSRIKKWLYGLGAGCIGGGASAASAWLGMVAAKAAGVDDIPIMNYKSLGIIFLSGVITNGLLYLKQSPLPPINGDTSFITKPETKQP